LLYRISAALLHFKHTFSREARPLKMFPVLQQHPFVNFSASVARRYGSCKSLYFSAPLSGKYGLLLLKEEKKRAAFAERLS
jgi:hypothetical protein